MTRVKQFADDLGISKNKAQSLINKGRNRKDGGSQILESVMADKDKKKKKKKSEKLKPQLMPYIKGGRAKRDDDDEPQLMPYIKGGRAKKDDNDDSSMLYMEAGRAMAGGGSNVTKINKGISGKAKVAQFKNIQNDVSAGKITQGEAERKIREIVLSKRAGGTYSKGPDPLNLAGPKTRRSGIDGTTDAAIKELGKGKSRKKKRSNVDDFKDAPKFDKRKKDAKKMLTTVKKILKRKDGGGFPDLTGDGKVTKKDILKGRGVPGFSRGGGMAIQGLGFKGVK